VSRGVATVKNLVKQRSAEGFNYGVEVLIMRHSMQTCERVAV
jgi:hypothetical protein